MNGRIIFREAFPRGEGKPRATSRELRAGRPAWIRCRPEFVGPRFASLRLGVRPHLCGSAARFAGWGAGGPRFPRFRVREAASPWAIFRRPLRGLGPDPSALCPGLPSWLPGFLICSSLLSSEFVAVLNSLGQPRPDGGGVGRVGPAGLAGGRGRCGLGPGGANRRSICWGAGAGRPDMQTRHKRRNGCPKTQVRVQKRKIGPRGAEVYRSAGVAAIARRWALTQALKRRMQWAGARARGRAWAGHRMRGAGPGSGAPPGVRGRSVLRRASRARGEG
jgi:hypothetical protein